MPFLIYSALRLALIVVAGAVLYLAGLRGLLLALVAIVVALLVSYLALSRPREAAAVYLAERRARRQATGERFSKAVEDDAAAEDERIESASAAEPARPTEPTAGAGGTSGDQADGPGAAAPRAGGPAQG